MHDAFRTTPTAELLRRVAVARAAGDWQTARLEWESCIARARERVVNVVDRYVAKGWIPRHQHEDVVQEALIRGARALVRNLDSLSENAFFASMVRCADFQCRDTGRRVMRQQQHERAYEDCTGWGDAEAAGSWDRDEEIRDAEARLTDAIARLQDERQRKLLTMQRLGAGDDQIAQELGTTTANVHTMRSRALMKLRGLIDR